MLSGPPTSEFLGTTQRDSDQCEGGHWATTATGALLLCLCRAMCCTGECSQLVIDCSVSIAGSKQCKSITASVHSSACAVIALPHDSHCECGIVSRERSPKP